MLIEIPHLPQNRIIVLGIPRKTVLSYIDFVIYKVVQQTVIHTLKGMALPNRNETLNLII